jgi:hypothetical protein
VLSRLACHEIGCWCRCAEPVIWHGGWWRARPGPTSRLYLARPAVADVCCGSALGGVESSPSRPEAPASYGAGTRARLRSSLSWRIASHVIAARASPTTSTSRVSGPMDGTAPRGRFFSCCCFSGADNHLRCHNLEIAHVLEVKAQFMPNTRGLTDLLRPTLFSSSR